MKVSLAILAVVAAATCLGQYQTPDQIVPPWSKGSKVMQCQRDNLIGSMACLPVRLMPSVRYDRNAATQLTTVSGPDPARSLWIQAIQGAPGDYNADTAAAPAVTGMPPNYFCVDLSPTSSGSGAALLLFDARIRMEGEDSSIRITGHLSTGPSLIQQLSAGVPWPGTYGWEAKPPAGTVHVYPIGPGCRNFPAISFEPIVSGNQEFIVEDVYVFVSIA